MDSANTTQNERDKYAEIAKKSLIRVQYSCSGNSDCYEEPDDIPIVNNSNKANNEDETKNT